MKTLKDLIVELKIRKGPAHGTTKRGAYWCPSTDNYVAMTRSAGGDGVGQNAPDLRYYLDFQHFRSGLLRAVVVCEAWHQNSGDHTSYTNADAILGATTAEEVVVALKGITDEGERSVLSNARTPEVVAAIVKLGLPASEPAPDDAPANGEEVE